MRDIVKKFHQHVLQLHTTLMYDSLIYPYNLITDTVREYNLKDNHNDDWTGRGYLAIKEVNGCKIRYFLQDQFIEHLPIRVGETVEFKLENSTKERIIVNMVQNPTPFRITPMNVFPDFHDFVDNICPFNHTNPDVFTFVKLNALQGYIGKTLTCVCGPSEFGKTSVYLFIDGTTQKSPVVKVRSAAGALSRITEDGNLVMDECQEMDTPAKRITEDLAMQIGDDRPVYHNGALKSSMTKNNYNISRQSMTFIYNVKSNYRDEKYFFENLWDNSVGMDSRFLKFKVEGTLTEEFDKEFDMVAEATKNRDYYIKVAKQLLYLKELRMSNGYRRRFKTNSRLSLKGRKRDTYNEVTWILDIYARTQGEYDKFIAIMDKSIEDYSIMVEGKVYYNLQQTLSNSPKEAVLVVEEEIIEETNDKPVKPKATEALMLDFIRKNVTASYESLDTNFDGDVDGIVKTLKLHGDIFETSLGKFKVLE